jgi:hypothetical protein
MSFRHTVLGLPILVRFDLAEDWRTSLNYIATALPRVQPRSACLPTTGAAREDADRHAAICAEYSSHLRQYSAKSASVRAAVSSTSANLSRDDQPSGPASGTSCPLPRASARHLCSVASEIPSSYDNCRMAMLFGGSIRFSTADLRSSEYPKSSPYPVPLRNRGKVEQRTTSKTLGEFEHFVHQSIETATFL